MIFAGLVLLQSLSFSQKISQTIRGSVIDID